MDWSRSLSAWAGHGDATSRRLGVSAARVPAPAAAGRGRKWLFPALLVALALGPDPVRAATDESYFVGHTRQQAIERFGKPASSLRAGDREVLVFSTCRLTLANGIVVKGVISDAAPPLPVAVAPAGSAASVASEHPAVVTVTILPQERHAALPAVTPARAQRAATFSGAWLLVGIVALSGLSVVIGWVSFRPRPAVAAPLSPPADSDADPASPGAGS